MAPTLLVSNAILASLDTVKTSPDGSAGKEYTFSTEDTGDAGSIPASGRSPGGGNGNFNI